MRRRLRSTASACTAVLVAACALGPDYQRPKENIPAAYRFDTAAGNSSFADQGWWQLYQDPTLQSLIREALDNNLDGKAGQRGDFAEQFNQQSPKLRAAQPGTR